jgi:hypothetical protein
MLIGRLLGWICLLCATIVAVRDGLIWFKTGTYPFIAGGELWYMIDVDSLNLAQAVVQRYLAPEVWDPGIQMVLLWPAAATFAGLGLILSVLFYRG